MYLRTEFIRCIEKSNFKQKITERTLKIDEW